MNLFSFCLVGALAGLAHGHESQPTLVPAVDLAAYNPGAGVVVTREEHWLRVSWPAGRDGNGFLVLNLRSGEPLIDEMGLAPVGGPRISLLRGVNPVTLLTVGVRDLKAQGWNVFFDNPPRRPHDTFRAVLQTKSVRVVSRGRTATVGFDGLSAGPFRGDLRLTFYAGSPLVHTQAVLATEKDACAILYAAGLGSARPTWKALSWVDTADQPRRVSVEQVKNAQLVASRYRTIVAETDEGAVAVFPPPHQFIYPLDFANNFKLVWHGPEFMDQVPEAAFGVRQPPEGDNRWVPWVNAPPGTRQHLSAFYLLTRGKGEDAVRDVRRYTHDDRFEKLDGYHTFTHHYHIEHTRDFLDAQKREKTGGVPKSLELPPFVRTFKAHGVDIVHLAEFHFAHTPEINAKRLDLLKTLHDECRRLSDDKILVLPGEEPNVHLGGHWISLFPRPVYWLLHPSPNTPFERQVPGLGAVYAVHSAADVLRLMEKEGGLMWTAHPRTKGSYGFPDRYMDSDFYRSDRFLGAGWKNMPTDLSQPRLGKRALDLLDDMANGGGRKYLVGEVDVFKVEPDYELYGHLNINYLKLDKLPRFDDGWQPVLDALRGGHYFVSTGEVLLPEFAVGGRGSGDTLRLPASGEVEVRARILPTFPLAFAEVVWGDGSNVHRRRVELSDGEEFRQRLLQIPVNLRGARWVRLEVWDAAVNGAFTQPVWIE
jgi:hypothetical protein